MAVCPQQLRLLGEPGDLVGLDRDGELAARLEVAVDPEPVEVGPEPVEVLEPEPLERRRSRRRSGRGRCSIPCVSDAESEAAVAAARAEPDRVGLEEDDVARSGSSRLRVERRPEPGEAAADDAEVGLGVPSSGRVARADRQRRSSQNGRGIAAA